MHVWQGIRLAGWLAWMVTGLVIGRRDWRGALQGVVRSDDLLRLKLLEAMAGETFLNWPLQILRPASEHNSPQTYTYALGLVQEHHRTGYDWLVLVPNLLKHPGTDGLIEKTMPLLADPSQLDGKVLFERAYAQNRLMLATDLLVKTKTPAAIWNQLATQAVIDHDVARLAMLASQPGGRLTDWDTFDKVARQTGNPSLLASVQHLREQYALRRAA